MRNIKKYTTGLLTAFFLFFVQPVWAAGPPGPSLLDNALALTLLLIMLLLLIVIAVLGNILTGTADFKLKKKESHGAGKSAVMTILLLLFSAVLFAQNPATATSPASKTIAGMDKTAFYLMVSVIFLELLIIMVMLLNIKLLLRKEKARPAVEEEEVVTEEEKANRLSWWDRFNALRPVSQEAELDLGHEYDGIRELNNRLPPWWLYGFYGTVLFAVIYLWRFEVSHSGPSSKEEYEASVARAEIRVQEYLKAQGESVDENTVKMLDSPEDLAAGKAIFTDPSKCPACHNPDGGGNAVGPNLTDDYWLYGGGIKDIFKIIKYGTSKGMRSWKDDLSPKQMAQVSSYVKSLKGTKPANPKEPQGDLYQEEAAPAAVADSVATAPK
ncbi:MAG: cbb3-type cytochrome c oxidase N-terminal domain-containing protein [Chitinophagaceae bacterium]